MANNNTDVVYLQSHSVPYTLGTPEQEGESGCKPLINLVVQRIHQHISVTGAEPEKGGLQPYLILQAAHPRTGWDEPMFWSIEQDGIVGRGTPDE